ncbi:alpha/beta fold hydrolase [Skermania piniformis]|uniref:Alpha/beta hydrolase n=1 Tax=Skermania pinensis TaxID=39122 RepID=A0ABX8SA59_9ACTN|nr:alpha/beta hydrolase [Skermania piniformis]QXQ14196.1 alpha/beta hydrolase [Skermania piniformis]
MPDPSSVRYDGPWCHRDIYANGIRFHAVEAGPAQATAPLILLLHGFADFWWSWRHQLGALGDAGWRAVAVDLRGYGDSDKPPRGYDGWTLAGDVAGLIRALGHTGATLVGHADGGLVCWATAVLHPRLVHSIALINSPHPDALKHAVLHDAAQRDLWLPGFLRHQLPRYPERTLTRHDGQAVEDLLRARSGPTWPGTADFADTARRLRSAIRIPGAAHCALEYQRWAFRSQWRADGRRFMSTLRIPLDLPVLQIHGELDPYIRAESFRRCLRWAPGRELVGIPGAGHFPHQECPERVTAQLLRFAGPR